MAFLNFYVISCSSDCPDVDARSLYVWGEWEGARWFPDTVKEARKRIRVCREKYKCRLCDAQVHKVKIERKEEVKPK